MGQKAALYARVSTRDQNPEAQLDRLREWVERQGMDAVEFVDRGASGRKTSRKALDALLAAVRAKDVDTVVAVKLDRLARSTRHLCDLADVFETNRVDLVCLDQSVDTRTAAGKLLYRVLGAVGEFEADLISERTRDGLAAARRRGQKLGRPRADFDRKRARRLRKSGHSVRSIAEQLEVSYGVVQAELASG